MIYDISGNILTLPNSGINSVSVAASNSTNADKAKADYVCTGTNDQATIQTAIDSLNETGGTVYLAYGDYYIDGWSYNTSTVKVALAWKPDAQKSIKIIGSGVPMNLSGAHEIGNTAILHVTANALNQITGNETNVAVIGRPQLTRTQSYLGVECVGIMIADNQHKMIVIDGKYFNGMGLKNIRIGVVTETYSESTHGYDYPLAVEDCIGIRGLNGSNAGAGYTIDQVVVFACGVAFDINGEHLIMTQCLARYCDYSYRFGYNNTIGGNAHDLTLINCSHEICRRFPVFLNDNNLRPAVNIYDYNVELETQGTFAHVSKAIEGTNGKTTGHINYTIARTSNWINSDEPFFEDGYGSNFVVVNTAYPS